jgi:hypothetical protein
LIKTDSIETFLDESFDEKSSPAIAIFDGSNGWNIELAITTIERYPTIQCFLICDTPEECVSYYKGLQAIPDLQQRIYTGIADSCIPKGSPEEINNIATPIIQ